MSGVSSVWELDIVVVDVNEVSSSDYAYLSCVLALDKVSDFYHNFSKLSRWMRGSLPVPTM